MVTSADLANIELFEGLSDDELDACAELMQETKVLAGQELTAEDDYAYTFVVVLDGAVEVKLGGEVIDEMGSGDFFGEVSLMHHQKRNATVVSARMSRLARVMTWDFEKFMAINPAIKSRIEAAAAERTHEE